MHSIVLAILAHRLAIGPRRSDRPRVEVACNASTNGYYEWAKGTRTITRHTQAKETIDTGESVADVVCLDDGGALIFGYSSWAKVDPLSSRVARVEFTDLSRTLRQAFPGYLSQTPQVYLDANLAVTMVKRPIETKITRQTINSATTTRYKALQVVSSSTAPILVYKTSSAQSFELVAATAGRFIVRSDRRYELDRLGKKGIVSSTAIVFPFGDNVGANGVQTHINFQWPKTCRSVYWTDGTKLQTYHWSFDHPSIPKAIGPSNCWRYWISDDDSHTAYYVNDELLVYAGGVLVHRQRLREVANVGFCKNKAVAVTTGNSIVEIHF